MNSLLYRLELSHSLLNTSHTLRMRLKRPTVEYSGLYECKVSTFHEEKTSALHMIVFGKQTLTYCAIACAWTLVTYCACAWTPVTYCACAWTKVTHCALRMRLKRLSWILWPGPTSQDAKPHVQPGVPPLLYNKCGGEPRVEHGVWRPEMWVLHECKGSTFHKEKTSTLHMKDDMSYLTPDTYCACA
jgi:hypothetical protein